MRRLSRLSDVGRVSRRRKAEEDEEDLGFDVQAAHDDLQEAFDFIAQAYGLVGDASEVSAYSDALADAENSQPEMKKVLGILQDNLADARIALRSYGNLAKTYLKVLGG